MFLIAGLGNPGASYRFTKHNIGFMVMDRLAEAHSIRFDSSGFSSFWGKGIIAGKEVILAKPQTFMNLVGRAVAGLKESFSVPLESIIVICDDCDLPFGRIRIRKRGGSGGHRGLKSIIELLDSDDFPRVRMGVGRPAVEGLTDYVLSPFEPDELARLGDILDRGADSIEAILARGMEYAMNRFNPPE